jgi:hypothetical protein
VSRAVRQPAPTQAEPPVLAKNADVVVKDMTDSRPVPVRVGQTVGIMSYSGREIWQVEADQDALTLLTPADRKSRPGDQGWVWRAVKSGTAEIVLSSHVPCPNPPCAENPARYTVTLDIIPLKTEKQRVQNPDSPDEALRWKQIFERDENGNIPEDGLMNARRQMDAMKAQQQASQAALIAADVEPPSIAGISNGGWTWVGPGNIGGRTRAVAIHPTSTNVIFIGSVAGGIWKSVNGGSSWNQIDDFMANLAISQILFRPGDPNTLFASTGEGFFNSDAIRGAGIFKSIDGGSTWSQLASTANSNFNFVNELAISPDGNMLLAATSVGIFQSGDLGASWQLRLSQSNVLDIKFIPGSNSQAVAAGRLRNTFFSVDGGTTWQPATGIPAAPANSRHRVELGVSVSNPAVVYASVEEDVGTPSTFWKSLDSGVTYAQASAPGHLGDQGWYDNAVWVDPLDVNHVIIGGVSMFRSTDGGVTFTSHGGGGHADQHAIISDPGYNGSTNRRVYIGNDGGIFKWENVTSTTTTNLNNNYGVTQFYGADGHIASGRIFGGTQDNGTKISNPALGPQSWGSLQGGDGGFASADQVNNFFYGEFQWLQVHRSNNGGTSALINGCSKAAPFKLDDGCTSSSTTTNFIAPILLDPNTPDRLFAGGASLWRSDDPRTANTSTTGPSWAVIKASTGSNISAIAVAKNNSDVIWVGHGSGDLYLAEDGTSAAPTWVRKDTNGSVPNRAVSSISVDPQDSNTAYVSFGGFNTQNIWVTHDRGASWAVATGSGAGLLPAVPVRWVVPHPTISGWIYAATDVGIFSSENGGVTWQIPHDGPANVAVFQLFFMGNTTLVAVTHGRGIYTAVVSPPSVPPSITLHPASQTVGTGQSVSLSVGAVGSAPLSFQWFVGASPSTSNPIPGATSSAFTTPALSTTTQYWVRVTNAFGTADSNTATITVDPAIGLFNGALGAPRCALVGAVCDTGPTLVNGRGNISGGSEPNQPNTINGTCPDGLAGTFHVNESIDRIKISTLDGLPFAPGKTVRIDVTVWADTTSFANDRLDIFGAPNAANPVWSLITTLTPSAGGAQTLTTSTYVLPVGGVQAIRGNFRRQIGGIGTPSTCSTATVDDRDDLIFAVNPPVGNQLVQNGDFSAGIAGWQLFEVPDIIHNSGGVGVFQFSRATPRTTPSGQAVIFQATGAPVGTDKALTATFRMGNADSVRKRFSVLIIDSDFSDISVCTFWLPANAAMATYQMKAHPTRGWLNAAIYFYAASDGIGEYLLDDVSLVVDAAASTTRTECIDPTRPTPPGGAAGANLLTNGNFATGLIAPWLPFFDIQHQISSGVLEFIRPGTPGTMPGGVMQSTLQAMTSGQIMTATFQLGNSSTVRKRVTVLLHDLDFSDLSACTFWLAPGHALSNYAMRSFVTKPTGWTNASISVYASTTGPEPWTRLDNVTLSRTPAGPLRGTECFEPGDPGPVAPPDQFVRVATPTTPAAPAAGSGSAPVLSPNIDSGGFLPATGAGGDGTWRTEAVATGRHMLQWADAFDLTATPDARLRFDSWLVSQRSTAEVQVSVDGVTWTRLTTIPTTAGWTSLHIDLSAFAGQHVYIRFVFDAVAPEPGLQADVWIINSIRVALLQPR